MIRKSYKQALGLTVTLSTDKLLSHGLNNTLAEIIEAQRISQLERLTRSDTGRHILQSLGLSHPPISETHIDIAQVIRDQLIVHCLPKHMHPVHNEERRRAKAQALHKQHSSNPQVAYVDAAEYPGREAMAAVAVDSYHRTLAALSFPNQFPTVGEELAIALAIMSSPKITTTL